MRSAFAYLMQHLYVDADPQIAVNFIDYSRVCIFAIFTLLCFLLSWALCMSIPYATLLGNQYTVITNIFFYPLLN